MDSFMSGVLYVQISQLKAKFELSFDIPFKKRNGSYITNFILLLRHDVIINHPHIQLGDGLIELTRLLHRVTIQLKERLQARYLLFQIVIQLKLALLPTPLHSIRKFGRVNSLLERTHSFFAGG
ncbi:hypothetical protein YC2023_015901 [Brassica napus]